MPQPPTVTDVMDYLGDTSWTEAQVETALLAEIEAQARVVRFPAEAVDYPADLAEALFRRVAANLAVRALPLGVQATMSEMAVSQVRVGGGDREVRRLEAPWRRLVVG